MSGRFPGAADLETFWRNLEDGVESIRGFDAEERRRSGADPSLFVHPDYVDARGVLDGVEDFDAPLFGFRPQEAAFTDPQQRVFLECVWEAFEDAGLDPARAPGPVGVFAGSSQSTYFLNHIFANPSLGDLVWALDTRIGNDKDFLPTRVAYKFDLEGPAVAVQTSCSTSLVAVHMACASLLEGGCDVALAGGVRISFPQQAGYLHQPGGVASPDGHCRAFSADAQGTVPGNGCGVVVLKRLADAEAAGDRIQAVILGSAINNDGARKVGYTAPGVVGQRRVIGAALAAAGVASDAIDYVETHGTGTVLGDPIEVAALRAAFGEERGERRSEPCLLGALKTNIGHLDAAAGVAGLIKTVLALRHRTIPPTLHFVEANPQLELETSPFAVAARATPWPRRADRPRRAGVSSFGIGGTNAHLVLEEAPADPDPAGGASEGPRLLLLSAHDRAALDQLGERLASHLEGAGGGLDLGAVAHTLAIGRRRLEYRRCVVARDGRDAALALRSPERRASGQALGEHRRSLIFLFPGQGAQHPGMGARLYRDEPLFRTAIDRGADWLRERRGLDLRPLLCAAGAAAAGAAEELASTDITQPALFVFEYALAELYRGLGFEPAAMIGHSVGEYVAATLAGVFTYEAALELVAERGRLIAGLPRGAMAAVELPAAELAALLPAELSIAAENAPASTVISGPPAVLEAFCETLRQGGAEPRRLQVSHAFHSADMDAILDTFRQLVAAADPQPPRLPFVSNLSGDFIGAAEATDPGYWARHLRGTVRFAAGVARLLDGEGGGVFLEVGPGQSLTALARRQLPAGVPAIASLPRASQAGADDREAFLQAVGRLWLAGFEPRLEPLFPDRPRRVALPSYPFQRRRCFVEMPAGAFATGVAPAPGRAALAPAPEPAPGPACEPAAEGNRPATVADYRAPRSAAERAIAELWQTTFGIAPIGLDDSFFDLGGDSLLAARLSAAMRREGFDVSMAQLISLGTIAALAPLCAAAPDGEAERLQELVADFDRMSVEELEAFLAQDEPINSGTPQKTS